MITFAAVLNKYGCKRYGLDIPALSHDWRALIPKKKRTGLTASEKETATVAPITQFFYFTPLVISFTLLLTVCHFCIK